MNKAKLIIINAIIWPIALSLIFFDDAITTTFYRLKNGVELEINQNKYVLSSSAYLIGSNDKGELAIALNIENIVPIFVNEKVTAYIDILLKGFPNTFTRVDVENCIFLKNTGQDPNLPELSWYRSDYGLYFTTAYKNVADSSYLELCNVISTKHD